MKQILCLLTLAMMSLNSSAQDATTIKRGLQLGYTINQYQSDFGVGVELTSPFMFNGSVAVRSRANLMFYQHILDNETTWTPYANYSLGLVGVGKEVNDFLRLYGEGGFVLITPSNTFSANDTEFGGYGLFGFEFFLMPNLAYKIEMGGMGTGANATKIEGNPIYSNGFMLSTGLRIQF